MQADLLTEIQTLILTKIQAFHYKRLERLQKLNLHQIIKRKNPYLFKAKNILLAEDYVTNILDAHLSSQEEGIFGGLLEELAIFVCNKFYAGVKSSAEGIDLEFEKDKIKYLVAVKSGPHWGNSRQIQKMRDDFRKARKILQTNTSPRIIVSVNGCCYGQEYAEKGDYIKICGQSFWSLISGSETLYTDLIEPFGYQARQRNEAFKLEYAGIVNKFTSQFVESFCSSEGHILWEKILKFNSAAKITPSVVR